MIQSFSNLITNSSSEVFVITSNKHSEIIEFLSDICKVFGVKISDIIDFYDVKRTGIDGYSGMKCKKGDLVIHSTHDNSIPSAIMEVIANLDCTYLPKIHELNINNIKRLHLG